jgi:quercetin dioxygenase-like cupin family protein
MSSKTAKSFGARLKRLRESEGLGLPELGTQVGMKPAYLAKLESDQELPPVADIIRLARVLSVDPSVFMEDKAAPGRRQKTIATRTADYAYETLTPDEHDYHLMAFRVRIDPKSAHRKVGYQHEGEEFIYVLSGKLKLTVGGKTKTLSPGETIHFDSGQRHHLVNPGKEPTLLVVVLYTP